MFLTGQTVPEIAGGDTFTGTASLPAAPPRNPSPAWSTATHCAGGVHAIPDRNVAPAISTIDQLAGFVGSPVTARPPLSTAVHWIVDGQATPIKSLPVSIVVGVGVHHGTAHHSKGGNARDPGDRRRLARTADSGKVRLGELDSLNSDASEKEPGCFGPAAR
jgi:hypothetical protein